MARIVTITVLASLVLIGVTSILSVETAVRMCVVLGLLILFMYAILWIYRVFPSCVQVTERSISKSVTTEDETTWKFDAIEHCEIASKSAELDHRPWACLVKTEDYSLLRFPIIKERFRERELLGPNFHATVLARRLRVKELLPDFDGRRLDDITDFLTYTFIPLLVIWRADLLPAGQAAWLLLPLVASAYGFCQEQVKTTDKYFLGFPSYWNVVAFYLYFLRLSVPWAILIVVVLAVLTFIPLRYIYPSMPGKMNRWTTLLAAAWTVLLLGILWPAFDDVRGPVFISLCFPAYYFIASWFINLRRSKQWNK